MKLLVTYLVADYDMTGSHRLRHDTHIIDGVSAENVSNSLLQAGFMRSATERVMPGAILSVRELPAKAGKAKGEEEE